MIVSIPSSFNFLLELFPIINRSLTGKDHILSFISFVNNVCTLSGFSKSDAILAHNLLFPIPTFTVNPNLFFMSSFILYAVFIGSPNNRTKSV